MPQVKQVAGTSAGAITAVMVALGYSAPEIKTIIMSLDFKQFEDGWDPLRIPTEYGLYKGNAFLTWLQRWFASSPGATFETEDEFAAGDRCVVRWVYRKVRDGQPWHLRGVDVLTVTDGKLSAKRAYVKG